MSLIQAASGDIIYISEAEGSIYYRINSGSLNPIGTWPVTLQNTNPTNYIKVFFETDITFNNSLGATDCYFECMTNYIQIGNDLLNVDGTRTVVTIDGISNYAGLVKNGDSGNNGYDNIQVQNIGVVTSNGSILAQSAGWLCQQYFGKFAANNVIQSCYSTGDITNNAGGIVGAYAGNSGNITIENCYSTGDIAGNYAGGIAGERAGYFGQATVNACFSTGLISGQGSGGICGSYAAVSGDMNIIQCYSTGIILGSNTGGIFGEYAGSNSGAIGANTCYSTGSIGAGADKGGIFGTNAAYNSGSATVTNCYILGTGAVFGLPIGNGTIDQQNCYVANGSWSDVDANVALDGIPTPADVGLAWARIDGPNSPYKLINIGYSPYGRSLQNNYSQTVAAGGATNPVIVTGHTLKLIAINGQYPSAFPTITFNDITGVIQTSVADAGKSYTFFIYDSINPYAVTIFYLTIEGLPTPTPTNEICCPDITNLKTPTYEIKNEVRQGNGLIIDRRNNSRLQFSSYSDYVKYKMARAYKD